MALEKVSICEALRKSVESGGYYDVDGPFGWMARMDKVGDRKYEVTLANDDNGLAIQLIVRANDDLTAAANGAVLLKHYHDNELYPKRPDECIRDWYRRTCPTDELWESIDVGATFSQYLVALARYGNPYACGINDSVVRERVMAATSHVMAVPYNVLYDLVR